MENASAIEVNATARGIGTVHEIFKLGPRGLPNPWIHPFQITRSDFRPILAAILAETLLYGIHVVLYIFASYILLRAHRRTRIHSHRHRRGSHHSDDLPPPFSPNEHSTTVTTTQIPWWRPQLNRVQKFLHKIQTFRLRRPRISLKLVLFFATTIMFLLATADIGVSYYMLLNHYGEYVDGLMDTLEFYQMIYPKFLIHLFNNVIADILLITRCYIIWGYNRILGYGAGFLLLTGAVLGFVSEATTAPQLKGLIGPYIILVFFLNFALTGLTAGRIWFIAREVGKIMGRQVIRPYNLVAGILLESGFIYSAAIISLLILSPTPYILVGATICIRMVCIMPIFLVVHVALGHGAKNLETSLSAARSNEVQLSSAIQFRTSTSAGVGALESANNRSQV